MYGKLRGSLCSLPKVPLRMYGTPTEAGATWMPACWHRGVLCHAAARPRFALTPDFTRLGLPETKTAFPSPTPFLLLVLILAHPSLLVLFLLPSAYLHLPPAPHPMGNPTTLAFFSASQSISTSPAPTADSPIRPSPTLVAPFTPTAPNQASFSSRVLFSFCKRFQHKTGQPSNLAGSLSTLPFIRRDLHLVRAVPIQSTQSSTSASHHRAHHQLEGRYVSMLI